MLMFFSFFFDDLYENEIFSFYVFSYYPFLYSYISMPHLFHFIFKIWVYLIKFTSYGLSLNSIDI